MDLSLTQSQEKLRTAAGEVVEREYSKEILLQVWSRAIGQLGQRPVGKNGVGGLAGYPGADRKYGGEGGSLTDAAIILEELGRGPAPGAFFSTAVLSVLALIEAGSEEQRQSRSPWRSLGPVTRIALAVHRSPLRLEEGVDPHEGSERRECGICVSTALNSSSRTLATPTFSSARRFWKTEKSAYSWSMPRPARSVPLGPLEDSSRIPSK